MIMNMNTKNQKGFSLIELMIVVAIIGVLSAIAVPQYNNYIARGQISEAMTLLAAAKTAVEEEIVSENTFARDSTTMMVLATDNACAATTLNNLYGITDMGEYIACVYVVSGTDGSAGTAATGIVGAIFETTGVNSQLAGKVVAFERTAAGVWSCLPNGMTTDVDATCCPAPVINLPMPRNYRLAI